MKFLARLFHTHDYGKWEYTGKYFKYLNMGFEYKRTKVYNRICHSCGRVQSKEFEV